MCIVGCRASCLAAMLIIACRLEAGLILFSETFDGTELPSTLNYTTDPGFTWISSSDLLFADRTADLRGVAVAQSDAGFSLDGNPSLTYSADMGKPAGASGAASNTGLVFGDYVALFHPGFTGGAFRLEKIDGAIDPREPVLINNQDMGFTPVFDYFHRVEATVAMQGDFLAIDILISGLGTDSLMHDYTISFLDTAPSLGDGSIGVGLRGGAPPSMADDAFFDNLQVISPIPEPGTLVLFGLGGLGVVLARRRRSAS